MNNDLAFIKWMWIKAGGIFSYTKWSKVFEEYSCPLYEHAHPLEWWMSDDLFLDMGYSLLLVRAIENINSSDDYPYFIQLNIYSICIENIDTGKELTIIDYNDPDYPKPATTKEIEKAKEAALRYIYEKETQNAD